jgi:hypothetical protein
MVHVTSLTPGSEQPYAEAAVWIELAWNQTSASATFAALAETNFTAGGLSGVNASVVYESTVGPCTSRPIA